MVAVLSCILLLLLPPGCASYRLEKVDPGEFPLQQGEGTTEAIVGLTTHSGETVEFDRPGAAFRDGNIVGFVDGAVYSIAVKDVQRVWVYREGRSTGAKIGIALAVLAGMFVVVMGIAVLTKESCPFIYSWNGDQFVFDGEPYGGAITRGLERDDYSELEHLRADDDEYRLLVTNEVRETQYTNYFRILVVDHPVGTRIAMDAQGEAHQFRDVRPPLRAVGASGNDLLPWLEATDERIWEPPPVAAEDGAVREVIELTFERPADVQQGRLLARAATGLWGSHMIREMLDLRGKEVELFYGIMDESEPARAVLHAWNLREELYSLKIEVLEPTGWEVRGILPGGGPFISEDRVIPLDLARAAGDEVRIRIRPPLGFWALDSFGMIWEPSADVDVQSAAPTSAITEQGVDVLADLLQVDDRTYAMPTTADRATLVFAAPPARPGLDRTVFLHSRGWYRLHLDEVNEPDRVALQELADVPDAAARLACEKYARDVLAHRGTER